MSLKFNIDRPKPSDEEINKQKDFRHLVDQFKKQSLKKARGDESWWKDKKVRYATVIAGVTVVCTITYLSIIKSENKLKSTNETITTSKNIPQKSTKTIAAAQPFVNPPVAKKKTQYTKYKVNNASGGKVTHPSSTRITVPKNSFVDAQGKQIVGEVTLEYREFHDIADIISNGIPMAHDSSGKKYNLETAGMFDIRGSQNGEPVYIAPSANLKVELASSNNEQRFNQYYLDTVQKNWRYLKKDVASELPTAGKTPGNEKRLQTLKHEIETIIPNRIDSVGEFYQTAAKKLPAVKKPVKPATASNKPSFKLEGSYEEFPELAAFENVSFEVGAENKNYTPEFHEITWSDLKMSAGPIPGKNYLLTLKHRNRTEKLIVYPVFEGGDLTKAEQRYKNQFDNYKALEEKRSSDERRLIAEMEAKQAVYLADLKQKQQEYEQRLKEQRDRQTAANDDIAAKFENLSWQAKAQRVFQVGKFGIYNSDCPHEVLGGADLRPIFVQQGKEKPVMPDHVYLIDHTRKTVFLMDRTNGFKLQLDPDQTYSLCVFTNNSFMVCPKETFKTAVDQKSNKFALIAPPEGADNIADLRKFIDI